VEANKGVRIGVYEIGREDQEAQKGQVASARLLG
jgi:hypothetical protein